MKIKTYNARDMRQALALVREEQGPDAIILSTRKREDGVEVTVAVDPEEVALVEAAIAQAPGPTIVSVPTPAAEPSSAMVSGSHFADLMARTAALASLGPAPAAQPDPAVGNELRSMRHLLEWQLAQLAWNDLTRRAPTLAELLKELTEMGVSNALAIEILRDLPQGLSPEDGQRRALAQLARRLKVTGDDLLDRGGRVAFVGPTGIGKTTGIAKLAARWVMRHGARDIALISMDDQRFGAHEQLRVLGRLLGVECYTVDNAEDLPALLQRLPNHRMVLVDTAGISPRDADLAGRAATMNDMASRTQLSIWLTLSAGAQTGVLEESLQNFAVFGPKAVVLTKLDEAASLGGALSALITAGLPLAYVAEGPRIPEDLAPARAHQLVARAVLLARTSDASASDELLVRKFGGVAHVIR